MKLKKVIFYQAVKLWDGNSVLTVNEGENKKLQDVTISIENHMITLECPSESEIIVIGTSNMREARYWREPYGEQPRGIDTPISYMQREEMESLDPRLPEPDADNGDIDQGNGVMGKDELKTSEPSEPLPSPVHAIPAGFDASKYAGKQKEEKVTKPKAQKAVK